jgi:glycosyltransferase involved in cell wall biosynthesis
VAKLISLQQHDVIVSDFLFPAASLPWELKVGTQAPWVLFQHNVESMIWRRRAEGLTGVKGMYWKRQRDRMWRFESQLSARFDGVLAVSDEDSRIFREEMRLSNVIGVVPTGVDLDYFQALPKAPFLTPTVLFMGSMDWYANVDAVLYFVSDIWPKVRERLPEAKFLIVGRQPPSEILALHSTDMGVEVTGTVPDVRPYMRKAHVMVVPLRIGGGTRLKIYEAMAAELPVVSTTVGAEGLPVVHGKHLLIADDSASIANEVIRVLLSPELAGSLSQNAFQEVVQFMSWKAAASVFESSCQGLLKEATL